MQTFREQVPGVLERYQRRTMRLTGQVSAGVRKNVAGPGWSARVLGGLINEYERAAWKPRSRPVPEYWNLYRRRLPGCQHARYQESWRIKIIYGGTDQLTALFAESGQKHVPGGLLPIAACHLGRTRIDSFTATFVMNGPTFGGSPVSRSTNG